jgi:hypothetical protein
MTTRDDAQARREANARQPTPSHILSALNLLTDYCAAHGYGCVVVGPDSAPAFLIDHVIARPAPPPVDWAPPLAELLAHIERVYLPGSPTRQLLAAYEAQAARLAVLDGPRVPRIEPDDYAAVAKLSE